MYQPQQQTGNAAVSSYNPYSNHYPNQYGPPATAPAQTSYFPTFPHAQSMNPPSGESSSTPEPSVTPAVASKSIQRLISAELRHAGFEAAHQPTAQRLELEVVAFMEQLFERAHEYANLANRASAIASDLILACEEFDLLPKELYALRKRSSKRKRTAEPFIPPPAPTLVPPGSRSPSPELLPSDDEDAPPVIPLTLRGLPSFFPSLPPKHTYVQTPASPPKKAALPSLEKKLKTAGLVQDSLQNLLLATEENKDNEDGELLGHLVNWETGIHPRKRWKLGP
ncbi:hypothetical protein BDQ12DRAFT_168052 [Crucibulum laeve]|uniref:Transcription initiation factor TFIID subunit 8 n=1 Tax=Crucibulum laeve TaxID=68775 RepID=A0A5C3MCW3_9AGAR|nr:hypothetical protein BDQ12DRAFT_168052 [Crucibulum laeve]